MWDPVVFYYHQGGWLIDGTSYVVGKISSGRFSLHLEQDAAFAVFFDAHLGAAAVEAESRARRDLAEGDLVIGDVFEGLVWKLAAVGGVGEVLGEVGVSDLRVQGDFDLDLDRPEHDAGWIVPEALYHHDLARLGVEAEGAGARYRRVSVDVLVEVEQQGDRQVDVELELMSFGQVHSGGSRFFAHR